MISSDDPYILIMLMALLNVVLYFLFLLIKRKKPLAIFPLYFTSTAIVLVAGCFLIYPYLRDAWVIEETSFWNLLLIKGSFLVGALVVNVIIITVIFLSVKLLAVAVRKISERDA
jgi:hypothetical protein